MDLMAHSSAQRARFMAEPERLLPYIAIEVACDGNDAPNENLQALTPRVMRWDVRESNSSVWILDLSACESYWLAQAKRQGLGAISLVRRTLQAMQPAVLRAAAATHPWQAVLLLQQMRERRLSGLVSGEGPFGSTLFREVSWDTWWACAETLVAHLEFTDRKRAHPITFRKYREQMKRSVQRLGIATPWQLKDIAALAIKRRFGALVHDLWDWSYSASEAPRHDDPTNAFPWRPAAWPVQPRVARHLEYSLCEWEHIEPFLLEDLNRLCALPSWQAGERIVSLEWCLVFHDLSSLVIPIRFRHPHSLHLESGHHRTTLLQALYSFEDIVPRQSRSGEAQQRRADFLPPIPIVSWDLRITERMTIPARALGLFDDLIPEESSLMQLENKLPIKLESYELRHDWLPEDSFSPRHEAERLSPAAERSLAEIARRRPIYLYRKPQLFDSRGYSSLWQFCERTMAKWWATATGHSLQRDYYRLQDSEQRSFWVFKDNVGDWFIHGIFA